jgi:hypothetical protein
MDCKFIPYSLYKYEIPNEFKINKKYPNNYQMICDYWINLEECPICKNNIKKEIKYEKECRKCRACNLGVFSPNNCSCEYYTVMTCNITCQNCNSCKVCNNQMHYSMVYDSDQCENCKKIKHINEIKLKENERKEKFTNEWKNSSPSGKLTFYGKEKLLILANKKNIKGCTSMDKKTLIERLTVVVSAADFPIK